MGIVVECPAGRFRGVQRAHDVAFLGIRYAEPPVGTRRFCAPIAAQRFTVTVDATRLPPACPAPAGDPDGPIALPVEPMDEDCLFLSVYTPAADDRRRPVLFWIHGGAFIVGSSRLFDGGAWCREQDVVVVTINYRLGPFGFLHLSHLDPALAGSINNGLRDQICALRWVYDNIESFGGDPQSITVFGSSAGAASVCALLACPEAKGLFQRAIAQSPGGPLPRLDAMAWAALTDLAVANLHGHGSSDALGRLRSASSSELLQAVGLDFTRTDHLTKLPPAPLPGTVTTPYLGPAIDGVVVTDHPVEAIRARGPQGIPMIIGNCRNEGTLLPQILGPHEYTLDEARQAFAAAGVDPQRALAAYECCVPGSSPRQKLVHALTETVFRNYTYDLTRASCEAGMPVWVYLLTWRTDHFDGSLGATHGLEFPFQWEMIDTDPYWAGFAGRNAPRALGPAIRALWASFARTGRPRSDIAPDWPRYGLADRKTLLLDRQLAVAGDPDAELRLLWNR